MSKQLAFTERISLTDGDRPQVPGPSNPGEIIFAIFIFLIIVIGAIGSGVWYATKNIRSLPDTDFMSRRVNVDLNGKDTVRVTITDKFIYHYNTLTDEQKKELIKEIE